MSEVGQIDLVLNLDNEPDLVLDHYVECGRNQDVDLFNLRWLYQLDWHGQNLVVLQPLVLFNLFKPILSLSVN